MNQLITALALAIPLTFASQATQAQAVEWKIDKNHTHIGFVARHLAFAKVRGSFKKFDAKITADKKTGKLTALSATADVASISTDNAKRDKHLRSDDFFAGDKHPKVSLKLKSIKWDGDDFKATVALTMRGKTKDVVFKGSLIGVRTVNFGRGAHQRAAYEATAKIKRQDFGLSFNGVAEGLSIVGDEVKLVLEMEASAK